MDRESVSAEAETPIPVFGLKNNTHSGPCLAFNNEGVFTRLGKVFRISGISDFITEDVPAGNRNYKIVL